MEETIINLQIPATQPPRPRRIYRVPPQIRANKDQQMYDPIAVSLGPYHHGKPQFRHVDDFKDLILHSFLSSTSNQSKLFYHNHILHRIHEIRSHYEEVEYDDNTLADIILRDASYLIFHLQVFLQGSRVLFDRFGAWTALYMYRDIYKLENQIPLWVITLLFNVHFVIGDGEALLYKFLGLACLGDRNRLTSLPWKDHSYQPLHLLDAIRFTVVRQLEINSETLISKNPNPLKKYYNNNKNNNDSRHMYKKQSLPFRSVTYLQAKGVFVKPGSHCIQDISFNSHSYCGILRLPTGFVNSRTKVFFHNVLAFEMSPDDYFSGHYMISYINFLRSLIEKTEDVKLLRERGLLYSDLGTDEEVFKLFHELNTHGWDDQDIYADVKLRIEEHCASKAKTWMAELIYTYFQSPWKTIALFAATVLLLFAFVQTLYAVHPAKTT